MVIHREHAQLGKTPRMINRLLLGTLSCLIHSLSKRFQYLQLADKPDFDHFGVYACDNGGFLVLSLAVVLTHVVHIAMNFLHPIIHLVNYFHLLIAYV